MLLALYKPLKTTALVSNGQKPLKFQRTLPTPVPPGAWLNTKLRAPNIGFGTLLSTL
jgi:hypothetical protein